MTFTFSNRTSSANNIFKLLKILKVSDLYQLNTLRTGLRYIRTSISA